MLIMMIRRLQITIYHIRNQTPFFVFDNTFKKTIYFRFYRRSSRSLAVVLSHTFVIVSYLSKKSKFFVQNGKLCRFLTDVL